MGTGNFLHKIGGSLSFISFFEMIASPSSSIIFSVTVSIHVFMSIEYDVSFVIALNILCHVPPSTPDLLSLTLDSLTSPQPSFDLWRTFSGISLIAFCPTKM